ncbi:hypothetical protein ACFQ51_20335 [Streptomyces kaempferi]
MTGSAPGLPTQVQSALGWVVREATTNVLRHGDARRCGVSLRVADGKVTLTVENDGVPDAVAAALEREKAPEREKPPGRSGAPGHVGDPGRAGAPGSWACGSGWPNWTAPCGPDRPTAARSV